MHELAMHEAIQIASLGKFACAAAARAGHHRPATPLAGNSCRLPADLAPAHGRSCSPGDAKAGRSSADYCPECFQRISRHSPRC
jgi:hypothetical protein